MSSANNDVKLVEFENYCSKCKHYAAPEWEDPCDDCMGVPARYDSHKPVRFEENKKLKKNKK